MPLDIERCCERVGAEIARLADVTDGIDPATPVPTCDEWTVADLLEHVGGVFRWAATMVRDSSQERLRREQMDWALPADAGGLPAWIRDGAPFVLEQFRAADLSTPMWAWGWPKSAAFWPRRMVHEIGIHRADAEFALGIEPSFDADVASDGVDELLDNLPHAEYFAPNVSKLRGDGEVLALVTTDASWRIELGPGAFSWSRAGDPAAATTVSATPVDLYLALYGRPATTDVTGDADLYARWIANSAL